MVDVSRLNIDQTRNSNGFFLSVDFLNNDILPEDQKILEYIDMLNKMAKLPVKCTVRDHYFPGGGWF
jgi:hypothetical protein